MSTPDGRITVVFNGEIYNYREIAEQLRSRGRQVRTDSDTEVLLHLYEVDGLDLVDQLRGMFAFAIHDEKAGRLVLGRDRLGKKPLYYAHPQPGTIVFGSELKALAPLAQAAGMRLEVDHQSVYDYLSFGVVPQPQTIYQGVSSLPQASVAVFEDGVLDIKSYWRAEFEPKLDMSYADAQARVRECVAEAVTIRLRSDVPLGVLLSGGLDSSVVTHEAVRAGASSLQTFTVATGGRLDESSVASRTAAHLGVRNIVLPLEVDPIAGVHAVVGAYDQPYADSSAIPTMQIARLAREHVTVVLTGDGGDESFAGYRRYAAATAAARFDRLGPLPARLAMTLLAATPLERRSRLGFAARFARGLAIDPSERYLAWTTDLLREGDKLSAWRGGPRAASERLVARYDAAAGGSALDSLVANDVSINLLSDLLVKMDIGTMSASLEARSPLLDHQVSELAWRLPDHFKVRGGVTKRVLRDAYRDALPTEVVRGAKRGFEVPLADWLNGPLRPLVNDLLGSPDARVLNYLDRELVCGLIDGTALRERNTAYLLYAILVLELWLAAHHHPGATLPT